MIFIISSILIYVFAAITQLCLKNEHKFPFLISSNIVASVLALLPAMMCLTSGGNFDTMIYAGSLLDAVPIRLDSLSSLFVFIIAFVSSLGTIYSKGYLDSYIKAGKKIGAHLLWFNIFIASMLLVVVAQHVLLFLVAWEIMSFSSFILMLFEDKEKEVRQTAIHYLVMMHIGVVFLIIGFIKIGLQSASLDFALFDGHVDELAFLLVSLGFGIKAGLLPLHTWLPKAHPVAPTHISAMMSGVMIKTGVYGILRFYSYLTEPSASIGYSILVIGLLSAFFGILYAVAQRNFKRLLAYSSVENMGIVFIGLGVGILGLVYNNAQMAALGFLGCFLHIFNHSLFKTLMFFAAGSVYSKTHTKDIEKLGGLVRPMKYTATLFLLGALAISALPPFNGFISEFLIYLGFLSSFVNGNYLLFTVIIFAMGILAFVGAMALIAFSGVFSLIFLGSARTDSAKKVSSDVPFSMRLPMIILAIYCLLIGLFPQWFVCIITGPVSKYTLLAMPTHTLNIVSIVNITLVALIGIILLLRYLVLQDKPVEIRETWGCGYQHPTPKMQYSSNSFTRPFLGFMSPFFVRELDFKPIKELFPKRTNFKAKVYDVFEYYVVKPLVSADENFLSKFLWIQSGNTQRYLIYGVVFLILTIVLLLGGVL